MVVMETFIYLNSTNIVGFVNLYQQLSPVNPHLGNLFKNLQTIKPWIPSIFLKTQIRSNLEYCSHICRATASIILFSLQSVIRLIKDQSH